MLCKYVYNFVSICNQMDKRKYGEINFRNRRISSCIFIFYFTVLDSLSETHKTGTSPLIKSVFDSLRMCGCETSARKIWLNVIEQAYNEHRQHLILHDLWTTNVTVMLFVFDTKIDYSHWQLSMLANDIDTYIHISKNLNFIHWNEN